MGRAVSDRSNPTSEPPRTDGLFEGLMRKQTGRWQTTKPTWRTSPGQPRRVAVHSAEFPLRRQPATIWDPLLAVTRTLSFPADGAPTMRTSIGLSYAAGG